MDTRGGDDFILRLLAYRADAALHPDFTRRLDDRLPIAPNVLAGRPDRPFLRPVAKQAGAPL